MRKTWMPKSGYARRCCRALALIALGYSLWTLWGCSLGDSIRRIDQPGCYTGGGVPIGKSRLSGRVVTQNGRPISGAYIIVRSSPQGCESRRLETSTDKTGEFILDNIPTGSFPNPGRAQAEITIQSNDPELAPQNLTISLVNGQRATILAPLPDVGVDTRRAASLSIVPSHVNLAIGQTVRFQTMLRDASGATLPYTPLFMLDDDFGTITPEGSFTSAGLGTGRLRAFWFNNLSATANIVVEPNTTVTPPPAPKETGKAP